MLLGAGNGRLLIVSGVIIIETGGFSLFGNLFQDFFDGNFQIHFFVITSSFNLNTNSNI